MRGSFRYARNAAARPHIVLERAVAATGRIVTPQAVYLAAEPSVIQNGESFTLHQQRSRWDRWQDELGHANSKRRPRTWIGAFPGTVVTRRSEDRDAFGGK